MTDTNEDRLEEAKKEVERWYGPGNYEMPGDIVQWLIQEVERLRGELKISNKENELGNKVFYPGMSKVMADQKKQIDSLTKEVEQLRASKTIHVVNAKSFIDPDSEDDSEAIQKAIDAAELIDSLTEERDELQAYKDCIVDPETTWNKIKKLEAENAELKQFKDYAQTQMDTDGEAFKKADKEIKDLKQKLADAEKKIKIKNPTPEQIQYLKDIIEWEKKSSEFKGKLP